MYIIVHYIPSNIPVYYLVKQKEKKKEGKKKSSSLLLAAAASFFIIIIKFIHPVESSSTYGINNHYPAKTRKRGEEEKGEETRVFNSISNYIL